MEAGAGRHVADRMDCYEICERGATFFVRDMKTSTRLTRVVTTRVGPSLCMVQCMVTRRCIPVSVIPYLFRYHAGLFHEDEVPQYPVPVAEGFDDAFYWSIVTATSTGYGDKVPVVRMLCVARARARSHTHPHHRWQSKLTPILN